MLLTLQVTMCADAPSYFIILLCLMPDDFSRQKESAATQWVKPDFLYKYTCLKFYSSSMVIILTNEDGDWFDIVLNVN